MGLLGRKLERAKVADGLDGFLQGIRTKEKEKEKGKKKEKEKKKKKT